MASTVGKRQLNFEEYLDAELKRRSGGVIIPDEVIAMIREICITSFRMGAGYEEL